MTTTTLLHDIPYHANPEHYFLALSRLGRCIWLDSGKPYSDYGRYDIICAAPSEIFENPEAETLQNAVAAISAPDLINTLNHMDLPFWGGALGFFNYEYNTDEFNIDLSQQEKHNTGNEALKSTVKKSLFGLYTWALIQDHKLQKSYLVFLPSCPNTLNDKVTSLLKNPGEMHPATFQVQGLNADLSEQEYHHAFDKIHEYILAGDSYQINFAQRFSGKFSGSPEAAYLALRKTMPSPFSAYIGLGDDAILSFSPERFIKIHQRNALTQPIKGTAPRGKTEQEDQLFAKNLQNSEKNRAENLMIVDLLRNDFSKSCEPFSVRVPSLFALESFANVHHLVSTVEGRLEENVNPLDFFLRCFPGGSITGAPKKRAMEIIHELEDHPRNIYCGSICYLSTTGHFDSNITIRTLLVSGDNIYCWGGGGIVADSKAEEEYQESLQKVGVLLNALNDKK